MIKDNVKQQKKFVSRLGSFKSGAGFTLMEIVVATTIFVVVMTGVLSLFNYTLKINRRSEALRQATQGMRGFVEFIVKEIRNGKIDYGVVSGSVDSSTGAIGPCALPTTSGINFNDSYSLQDNKLKLINPDGQNECIYFADSTSPVPNYVGAGVFAAPTFNGSNAYTLVLEKKGFTAQVVNPPNFRIERLSFFIRPTCDPQVSCVSYSNSYPKVQPFVTLLIKFVVKLPTGEQVPISYQTSISTNNYDF
jgi:type II secretory pathway pseudopilin PulG